MRRYRPSCNHGMGCVTHPMDSRPCVRPRSFNARHSPIRMMHSCFTRWRKTRSIFAVIVRTSTRRYPGADDGHSARSFTFRPSRFTRYAYAADKYALLPCARVWRWLRPDSCQRNPNPKVPNPKFACRCSGVVAQLCHRCSRAYDSAFLSRCNFILATSSTSSSVRSNFSDAIKGGRAEAGLIIHEGQLPTRIRFSEKSSILANGGARDRIGRCRSAAMCYAKYSASGSARAFEIVRKVSTTALPIAPSGAHSLPYARDMNAELAGRVHRHVRERL